MNRRYVLPGAGVVAACALGITVWFALKSPSPAAVASIDIALSGVHLASLNATHPESDGEIAYRAYAEDRMRRMFIHPSTTELTAWSAVLTDGVEHGGSRIACGFANTINAFDKWTGPKLYLVFWDGAHERICHEDAFAKACSDITATPLFASCIERMKSSTRR